MSQSGDHSSEAEKDSNIPGTEPAARSADIAVRDELLMAGPTLVIIIVGLALAAFLIALDTSIVATVRYINDLNKRDRSDS